MVGCSLHERSSLLALVSKDGAGKRDGGKPKMSTLQSASPARCEDLFKIELYELYSTSTILDITQFHSCVLFKTGPNNQGEKELTFLSERVMRRSVDSLEFFGKSDS